MTASMRTISKRAYDGEGNWRPMAVTNVWIKKTGALNLEKNAVMHSVSQIPGYTTAFWYVVCRIHFWLNGTNITKISQLCKCCRKKFTATFLGTTMH